MFPDPQLPFKQPLLVFQKTYDLPDQVSKVAFIPGGIYNSKTELIRTYSEAKEATAQSLGISSSFVGIFGLSASRSLRSMEEAIFNKSRYIERVSAFESAWSAQMIPDFILLPDRYFQYYVDKFLPDEYTPSEDPSVSNPYKRLIHYYGTHYFKKANFGGILLMEMETSSDYYLKRSESSVKNAAQTSFLSMVADLGSSSSSNEYKVDESFKAMTSATTR